MAVAGPPLPALLPLGSWTAWSHGDGKRAIRLGRNRAGERGAGGRLAGGRDRSAHQAPPAPSAAPSSDPCARQVSATNSARGSADGQRQGQRHGPGSAISNDRRSNGHRPGTRCGSRAVEPRQLPRSRARVPGPPAPPFPRLLVTTAATMAGTMTRTTQNTVRLSICLTTVVLRGPCSPAEEVKALCTASPPQRWRGLVGRPKPPLLLRAEQGPCHGCPHHHTTEAMCRVAPCTQPCNKECPLAKIPHRVLESSFSQTFSHSAPDASEEEQVLLPRAEPGEVVQEAQGDLVFLARHSRLN
ncbi:uncharacterized protein LOC115602124 [Strigops habroptila]|uniref:uncharacterized protein LOC115602124 n=1 Tax=Strigops habroptila TaxID=2489341 RepID=UPI0011CEF736|nr:uncharacterized protein LOC115602124 [Strigops habroptila]